MWGGRECGLPGAEAQSARSWLAALSAGPGATRLATCFLGGCSYLQDECGTGRRPPAPAPPGWDLTPSRSPPHQTIWEFWGFVGDTGPWLGAPGRGADNSCQVQPMRPFSWTWCPLQAAVSRAGLGASSLPPGEAGLPACVGTWLFQNGWGGTDWCFLAI